MADDVGMSLVTYNHEESDDEDHQKNVDLADNLDAVESESAKLSQGAEELKPDANSIQETQSLNFDEDDNMDIDDEDTRLNDDVESEVKLPDDVDTTDKPKDVKIAHDPFSDEEVDTAQSSPSQDTTTSKHKTSKPLVPRKKPKMTAGFSLVSYDVHEDDDDEEIVDGQRVRRKTKSGSSFMDDEEHGSKVLIHVDHKSTESSLSEASHSDDDEGSPVAAIELASPEQKSETATDEIETKIISESGQHHRRHRHRWKTDNLIASSLARSVQNMKPEDIVIPPEPEGQCSPHLQKKVITILERHDRPDLNQSIQDNKFFRNPSIYDKLISFLNIDEKGTNFPPNIYNPYRWGPESFYDDLARVQNREVEKREKERKEQRKVEFVSATKTASGVTKTDPTEPKKRSKWDAAPTTKPSTSNSDTTKTIIPSTGNLIKIKKEPSTKPVKNVS